MKKKLNADQLLKIIHFALEQNKRLQGDKMPAEAFPYYMEGKLVAMGHALRIGVKNTEKIQNDIAEALAIIMRLNEAKKEGEKKIALKGAA